MLTISTVVLWWVGRFRRPLVTKIIAAALALAVSAPALAAAAADAPAPSAAAIAAAKGKMLVSADGSRLAPVYRVTAVGAQLIVDGRMVTVPSSSIALNGGKLQTSLTKAQVIALP